MTVTYGADIATVRLGAFGRLLFRWKASIYKLVFREMLIYVLFYAIIAFIYRTALNCDQQKYFEAWAFYCNSQAKVIPVTFILGFYVDIVLRRWWKVFESVRTPDRVCFYVDMLMPSDEPTMTQYRRAIARYLNLAQVLVLRDVSTSVKIRFPTLDKVVEDGFMSRREQEILEQLKGENQLGKHQKHWLVIHWASDLLCKIYDTGGIRNQGAFQSAFNEIMAYRDNLAAILAYDWVTLPLAYTQVVTWAVGAYFMTTLVGSQYLIKDKCEEGANATTTTTSTAASWRLIDVHRVIQMYFPIFPVVEFLFYMGWLKVAESTLNPMGEDDDDFEMNYIINRNLAVSYAIVDSQRFTCPVVKKEITPSLPEATLKAKKQQGSASNYMPTKKEEEGTSGLTH